ncbi:TetR family transcriptional regulator (plasmid) [Streptomyces sp. NBC_01450]
MPAPPRKERADAARSRGATLGAARLFDEHSADGAATDQVAAAAGVGRGTLFRRFGDRSGLATALLTDREQTLPGSRPQRPAPSSRIWSAHRRLRPRARYWAQACHLWHRHVRTLLNAISDPHAAAHTLPATLSAEHVTVLLRELCEHRELTPRSLRSRSAATSPTVSRRD